MKNFFLLSLLLVVIMSSCDFFGEYRYYIENGLASDTVTIKTHRNGYRYPTENMDSVFVLLPKERKLINVLPTGPSGKHEHPGDIMEAGYYELGQFEVFINGVKLEKSLWERKYWEYTTKELEGTYLLVIDEQIISEENE
ncbi:MAG: hypothetical protein LBI82_09585 [Dysgonamonadaceae bacterium]|jgi:hypothetical protein|nr:hypothetical protein [Dysgonamonadaceae bacterium]